MLPLKFNAQKFWGILMFLILININTFAQITHLDTNLLNNPGAGNRVNELFVWNNKIILAGEFNTYNSVATGRLIRLNSDGSNDTTFKGGTRSEGPIRAAALQEDGKIIIGGLFTNYNGIARQNLARIKTDGNLDSSFYFVNVNNEITHISILKDSTILINGFFSQVNGKPVNNFAKIKYNGLLDSTFITGTGGFNINVTSAYKEDKILIAGNFINYLGQRSKIAMLNYNGSIDSNFNAGNIDGAINALGIQTDNKIIICGSFTNVNGINKNRIARLNVDGSLDASFVANTNGIVRTIQVLKNGDVVLGGDFTNINGQNVQRICLLDKYGNLKSNPSAFTNGTVNSIYEQEDKNILIAGAFTQCTDVNNNNRVTGRFARLINDYCIPGDKPNVEDTVFVNCNADSVILSFKNANLNESANWFWYKDSLNTPPIDTGESIVIYNPVNATYVIRAEGSCTINGESATIIVQLNDKIAAIADTNQFVSITAFCKLDSIATPIAVDNCDGIIYGLSNDLNLLNQIGAHTIRWTFSDQYGNVSQYNQKVTITGIDTSIQIKDSSLIANELNADVYQWFKCVGGNKELILNATAAEYFPDESGLYAVTISKGECTDSSDCIAFLRTGIAYNYQSIKVYPNPTNDVIYWDSTDDIVELKIMNGLGQIEKLISGKINVNYLNLDDLQKGIYYLEIKTNKAEILRSKILKK